MPIDVTGLVPLFIPSPPQGEWTLFGVIPIRAYALCIMTGIVVGLVLGRKRWIARGGNPDTIESVAIIAVPLGIVGARLYHVITDYQLYFGPGRDPIKALYVWEGGLGIWGAVALGSLGAWLVCRRRKVKFLALADALAPGVVLAQAIGRLGNWFNQELYGAPTTLPWGLEIDPAHRISGYADQATYHPTFLYELLWNVGVCVVLVVVDRRLKLGHGKVMAAYIVLYSAGRFWIEALRIDQVNHIGEFRLNNYTSFITFAVALVWLIWLFKNRPGREEVVDESARSQPAAKRAAGGDSDVAETKSETEVKGSDGADDAPPDDSASEAEILEAESEADHDEPADSSEPREDTTP